MTSMPGVHSGGLNQCTPRKRAGSLTATARPSIGSDEVLEVMIAVAGAAAEMRPSTSSLSAWSSGTASITRSASPTAASRSGGVVTRAVASVASRGQQPGVDVPARAREQPLPRLLGKLLRRVDERHLQPGAREVAGDPAAHRPPADHRHRLHAPGVPRGTRDSHHRTQGFCTRSRRRF